MPIRDQILSALCPPTDDGLREPLASGLSFGEILLVVSRNRTSVARALSALREEHLVVRAGHPNPRWYATGAPELPVVRATRVTLTSVLLALGAKLEPPTAPISALAVRVAEEAAAVVRKLRAAAEECADERDDAVERASALEAQLATFAAARTEAEGGYRLGYRDGHRDAIVQRGE